LGEGRLFRRDDESRGERYGDILTRAGVTEIAGHSPRFGLAARAAPTADVARCGREQTLTLRQAFCSTAQNKTKADQFIQEMPPILGYLWVLVARQGTTRPRTSNVETNRLLVGRAFVALALTGFAQARQPVDASILQGLNDQCTANARG
jgi:hypothetical protein